MATASNMCLLGMICLVSIATAAGADRQLPAFPGAEGFGAAAVGGRGERVIKVTNLNADGPGSLQDACEAEGPRIVVFDVSGVIRGDVRIPKSSITIAGQTAPGAGITIEGMLQAAGGNRVRDVIVRFLRLRPRHRPGHSGDAVQMGGTRRVILDHCSLSWAVDETIDITTPMSSSTSTSWLTVSLVRRWDRRRLR